MSLDLKVWKDGRILKSLKDGDDRWSTGEQFEEHSDNKRLPAARFRPPIGRV